MSDVSTIDHYQQTGFAEIFARNDETRFTLPTIEELQKAYNDAKHRDGPTVRIKGFVRCVDWADADLRYNSAAFTPDEAGLWYWMEPVYDSEHRLIDLIYMGGGCNDEGHLIDADTWKCWGWTLGRAALLGGEHLDGAFTESAPCQIYTDIDAWRENHRDGIVILKPSAKALLRRCAYVRLDNFVDVEQLAADHFPLDSWRVQYPSDPAAYALWIAMQAKLKIENSVRPYWLPETLEDMDKVTEELRARTRSRDPAAYAILAEKHAADKRARRERWFK